MQLIRSFLVLSLIYTFFFTNALMVAAKSKAIEAVSILDESSNVKIYLRKFKAESNNISFQVLVKNFKEISNLEPVLKFKEEDSWLGNFKLVSNTNSVKLNIKIPSACSDCNLELGLLDKNLNIIDKYSVNFNITRANVELSSQNNIKTSIEKDNIFSIVQAESNRNLALGLYYNNNQVFLNTPQSLNLSQIDINKYLEDNLTQLNIPETVNNSELPSTERSEEGIPTEYVSLEPSTIVIPGAAGANGPDGVAGTVGPKGADGPAGAVGSAGPGILTLSSDRTVINNSLGDYTNDDFVFGESSLTANVDKFFFDKSHSAFSIGTLFSPATYGQNSIRFEESSSALGDNAVAIGVKTEVDGDNAVAVGQGEWATATQLTGDYAATFGYNNDISGNYGAALGAHLDVAGDYSLAFGYDCDTTANGSIVIGRGVWGSNCVNNVADSILFNANSATPHLFIETAGGGSNIGNVGIGLSNPDQRLHINGAMRLEPQASAPGSAVDGDMYYDTSHALCVYVSGGWTKLGGAGSCV